MPADSSPLSWLADALADLDARGLRRALRERGLPQTSEVEIDGRRLVNFSANDYLGLANHPLLAEAARHAIAHHGWGAGASPLVTGRSSLHAELERRLAEFEGEEAALLFPSGFAANAGVIPALADAGDAIFSDAKNHASLIDGCRLSRADTRVYPHNDVQELARLLAESSDRRRRLIVTDTLFSMDGDFAPLARIAELAVEHDAVLLVDEAHATGVWGATGRGCVEHFADQRPSIRDAAIVKIGTLSKALGCAGGFVAGSQQLIDYLANRARSYVFSTAHPAANCAAALAALGLVRDEPARRRRVRSLADSLRGRLRARGWDCGASVSQIVPVVLGDVDRTMQAAARLLEAGLLVPAIRPPTVPPGESLLRISLSADHREQQLERLIDVLGESS
ncbi:8-amino-7-oxononanoate synthase [Posidoniimonas corsicana]|uniref:8-amino-7-ketopelargonate synthase n=1 Tax=Posidoniimonas corsicana TaxID=1938618 RepID=A0A5C5V2A8_9BACT|nr:8-amino-7-oxononanoate synthase [Posidoniimonas corsicana]TWT32531.1 8-amino-7-oxononanoate synthase [Posidoniimonas corsicana]